MADIASTKKKIDQNQTQSGSAVSELTDTEIGGNVNHYVDFEHNSITFNFNGPISVVPPPQEAPEPLFVIPFDINLVGYSFSCYQSGTSGFTETEIKYFTSPGVLGGLLFSTNPEISSAAADNGWVGIINGNTLGGGTGFTQGVLGVTTLTQGTALRVDFINKATDSKTFSLELYYQTV